MKRSAAILWSISLLALAVNGTAGEVRRFNLRDWSGREWGPELLTYQVELPARTPADQLVLRGPEGQPVSFQLGEAEKGARRPFSFVAALSSNTVTTYVLETGQAPALPAGVARRLDKDALELSNERLAIRVPPVGDHRFDPPRPAADVPGPIQGFRLADGTWAGGSALATPSTVTGMGVRVTADGPVFKEVEIAYRFESNAYYRVRLRVVSGLDFVAVREESDFGAVDYGPEPGDCETPHYLIIDLSKGWKPDTLRGIGPLSRPDPIKQAAGHKIADRGGAEAYLGKPDSWVALDEASIPTFEYPLDFTSDHLESRIRMMSPWGNDFAYALGVFRDADWQNPDAPFVGVVPLHAGWWRRGLTLEVWSTKDGQAELRLPIGTRMLRWDYECGEESSSVSSGEFDPAVPPSFSRRQWALVLGGVKPALALYRYRILHGFVGLDHTKDWITDWPDTGGKYPRVFVSRGELDGLRRTLDRNPAKATLAPILDDSPEAAAARADSAVKGLRGRVQTTLNGFFHSHYRQLQFAKEHLGNAELALASPHLSAEQRKELRATLALYSYTMADPDVNPRGPGNHLGNPTMPFNRIGGLAFSAAMIPDHPRSAYWLGQMEAVVDYFLGRYIAPGGVFIEDPGYFIVTGATLYTQMIKALQNAGRRDFGKDPRFQAMARYAMNLSTPVDPRFGQRRLIGFGTHDAHPTPVWIDYAAILAGRDDALARQMMWTWRQSGALTSGADFVDAMDFLWLDDSIASQDPQLRSEVFPGFGALLRANVGDSANEAMVALRFGYQMSHWEPDQGHFAFFAKGAPVVPPWLAHYKFSAGVPAGVNHLNTIRFGKPDKEQMFGLCDARVSRHAFLGSAAYARGVVRYPVSYSQASPGLPNVAAPQLGLSDQPGEFFWTRQAQLLKPREPAGSMYLVVRDSVQGAGLLPSWWHLWAQGAASDVTVAGHVVTYRQPFQVTLNVHVLEPASPAIETIPHTNAHTKTDLMVLTRIAAPAGAGYLTVLDPFREGEKPATVERLAQGAVKVAHEEGTDYVFLSPTPIIFERDGVVFEGCAGAVRVRADTVALALTEGPGRIGYRGTVIEGLGPFEETVALTGLGASRTIRKKAAVASFPLPRVAGDTLAPGVTRQSKGETVTYVFDLDEPGAFQDERVSFTGQKGAIELGLVERKFVLAEGAGRLAAGDWYVEGEGPAEIIVTRDEVRGRTDGPMRVFLMPVPAGIWGLPDLWVDGVRWCPGSWDRAGSGWYAGIEVPRQLAVPVPAGKHEFVVKRFVYPPVWEERP